MIIKNIIIVRIIHKLPVQIIEIYDISGIIIYNSLVFTDRVNIEHK